MYLDDAPGLAVALVTLVGSIAFFVWCALFMGVSIYADNACLKAGYPNTSVSGLTFKAYCVKRVDQTDVVVPLSEIR